MAASDGRAGRTWRRIRLEVLQRDPYCTIRGPRCTGVSTTVDHIVPLSRAPELAHDKTNLRGACGPCNYAGGARITNSKASRRHPAADYYPPGHPVVNACGWSKDNPGRVCVSQCDRFPIPIGCRQSSVLFL